jgi:hypothetical protein
VRVIGLVVATTMAIELLQLHIVTGRDASPGDVLFNTIGGALGALLAERARALIVPSAAAGRRLAALAVTAWLVNLAATTLLLAPSVRGERFEWAITPSLDGTTRFGGRVLEASFADHPRAAGMLSRAEVLGAIAASGLGVEATVVPGAVPARLAPIVRLSSVRDDEIVMLGQSGARLVLEVRTRAAELRLRPPSVTLDAVFPTAAGAPRAPVRIAGGMRDGRVQATAVVEGRPRRAQLDLRPTLGWTFFVPGRLVLPGAVGALTLLWIAGFLVPLGYWATSPAAAAHRAPTAGRLTLALSPPAAIALVGLAIAPHLTGIRAATAAEWLVAAASMAAGAALARVVRRRRGETRLAGSALRVREEPPGVSPRATG